TTTAAADRSNSRASRKPRKASTRRRLMIGSKDVIEAGPLFESCNGALGKIFVYATGNERPQQRVECVCLSGSRVSELLSEGVKGVPVCVWSRTYAGMRDAPQP